MFFLELRHKDLLDLSSSDKWPGMMSAVAPDLLNKRQELIKNSASSWARDFSIEMDRMKDSSKFSIYLRMDAIQYYKGFAIYDPQKQQECLKYCEEIINNCPESRENGGKKREKQRKRPLEKEQKCEKCGFYVCKCFCIIKPPEFPYYAVLRLDSSNIITISPCEHCNNEEWIQKREAWEAVDKTRLYLEKKCGFNELSVDNIFINFGKWQSQAENLAPDECHAHINVSLTFDVREHLK